MHFVYDRISFLVQLLRTQSTHLVQRLAVPDSSAPSHRPQHYMSSKPKSNLHPLETGPVEPSSPERLDLVPDGLSAQTLFERFDTGGIALAACKHYNACEPGDNVQVGQGLFVSV